MLGGDFCFPVVGLQLQLGKLRRIDELVECPELFFEAGAHGWFVIVGLGEIERLACQGYFSPCGFALGGAQASAASCRLKAAVMSSTGVASWIDPIAHLTTHHSIRFRHDRSLLARLPSQDTLAGLLFVVERDAANREFVLFR